MDLLVSYQWSGYRRAEDEIIRILKSIGDPQPQVEKTHVPGICVVHTSIDNREVITRCKHLGEGGSAFRFAIKWVPVDCWAEKDLDAIRRLLREQIAPRIGEKETWAMEVEKRSWHEYHTAQIVQYLATAIDRSVNLSSPDKLVRLDILDGKVAISLLLPEEIFSTHALQPHGGHKCSE